jgi:hypothetical protein
MDFVGVEKMKKMIAARAKQRTRAYLIYDERLDFPNVGELLLLVRGSSYKEFASFNIRSGEYVERVYSRVCEGDLDSALGKFKRAWSPEIVLDEGDDMSARRLMFDMNIIYTSLGEECFKKIVKGYLRKIGSN